MSRAMETVRRRWKVVLGVVGVPTLLDILKEYFRGKIMEWVVSRLGWFGQWLYDNPFSLLTIAVACVILWFIYLAVSEQVGDGVSVLVDHNKMPVATRPPIKQTAATIVGCAVILFLVLFGAYQQVATRHTVPPPTSTEQLAQEIAKKPPKPSHDKEIVEQQPVKITPTAKVSVKKAKLPSGPTVPQPPSISQECAPGANCAMSSGQQGGITVGKIDINTPPIRQLTEAQKQGIISFLKTIPQSVLVAVSSIYGSGDGDMYANQFLPLFEGRHYEHQTVASIRTGFPAEFTGVFVATVTDDDPAAKYRDAFVMELVSLGIDAHAAKGSKLALGNLDVLIGYRPEEVKRP